MVLRSRPRIHLVGAAHVPTAPLSACTDGRIVCDGVAPHAAASSRRGLLAHVPSFSHALMAKYVMVSRFTPAASISSSCSARSLPLLAALMARTVCDGVALRRCIHLVEELQRMFPLTPFSHALMAELYVMVLRLTPAASISSKSCSARSHCPLLACTDGRTVCDGVAPHARCIHLVK